MSEPTINSIQLLIHGLMAVVAGFLRLLNGDDKNKFSLKKFVVGVITSGFVGVVTFFLAKSFELNDYATAFLASVAGWLGGSIMDFFGGTLKKFVDKKVDGYGTD